MEETTECSFIQIITGDNTGKLCMLFLWNSSLYLLMQLAGFVEFFFFFVVIIENNSDSFIWIGDKAVSKVNVESLKTYFVSNSLDLKYMSAALYRVFKTCGFVPWDSSSRVVSKFFSGGRSHLVTRAMLRGNTSWRSDINVVSWHCVGPLPYTPSVENWSGFKAVTCFCRAASQHSILEWFFPPCFVFFWEYGNRTRCLLLNSSGSGMPCIYKLSV